MYKIFIGDHCLHITNKNNLQNENVVFVNSLKKLSFKTINSLLMQYEAGTEIILLTFYPEKAFQKIFKQHKYIEAAGGLVRVKSETLFIKRNDVWDLPKGKREKGESIEMCAIREVEEECGLSNVEIKNFLCNTYHTYEMKGKKYLKQSFWFLMTLSEKQSLIPQTDEGISEAKWVKNQNLASIFKNTYPSILEVLSLK